MEIPKWLQGGLIKRSKALLFWRNESKCDKLILHSLYKDYIYWPFIIPSSLKCLQLISSSNSFPSKKASSEKENYSLHLENNNKTWHWKFLSYLPSNIKCPHLLALLMGTKKPKRQVTSSTSQSWQGLLKWTSQHPPSFPSLFQDSATVAFLWDAILKIVG